MRRVDRYLVSEIIGPFVLATVAFILIGMADVVFVLIDQLINKHVPLLTILQLLIFHIPKILVIFFPMALLFAVMLVFFRLAKDNELTVFRGTGVNLVRLILPVLVFSLFCSGISWINNDVWVPWSTRKTDAILREMMLKKVTEMASDSHFIKDPDGRLLYIGSISADQTTYQNVVIIETSQSFPKIIYAKKATPLDRSWQLRQGIMTQYHGNISRTEEVRFDDMTVRVDPDVQSRFITPKEPRQMNGAELKSMISVYRRNGLNVSELYTEYLLKYAWPLACSVFAGVALSLCMAFVKTTRDWWGVIMASIIAALMVGGYITLTAMFRAMGRGGVLPPILAAWGANALYSVVSAGILLKKANQ